MLHFFASHAPIAAPRSAHRAQRGRAAACLRAATGALTSAVIVAAVALALASPADAATRTLELYFTHTKEKIKVVYKRNGRYDQAGLRDLNRFLRDWRRNESTKMDPELFDLLWEVQQEFGGRTIHVVSAYRSPATNSMLRSRSRGVARNSQHMAGKAIDFFIPGAKISKVRTEGMKRQVGGVGYYPRSGSPFVHFDTGRVRSWPRMPRGELARLFPDGKTLHLPSSGKPLSGYKAAETAEKAGKLASLNTRSGGGGRSLFGFGGGGRQVASDPDPQRGILKQPPRQERQERRPPEPKDEPVQVRTASLGPVSTSDAKEEERGGLFRQLPTASLGGLINRFRRNGEEAPGEVTPVAVPQEPLTAVAVEAAAQPEGTSDDIETLLEEASPAVVPVPRVAPRAERTLVAAAPAENSEAEDDVAETSDPGAPVTPEEIELAALPPQRPALNGIATDATAGPLAYARDGDGPLGAPGSPQSSATALIPREAVAPPFSASPSQQIGRPSPLSGSAPVVKAAFSPVRGASPLLIADGSNIGEGGFADLTAPDRVNASKNGMLMADGFLGAPRGLSRANDWLDTNRFSGLRITVYASPRS